MTATSIFALVLATQGPPPLVVIPSPPPPLVRPQRVRPDLSTYFATADYPAAALRAREEGTIFVRLAIGPDGRVSDCAVTRTSGSAALDSATCRILRSRARYTPAHDAAGTAYSGTDFAGLRWRLPDDAAARPGAPVSQILFVSPPAPPPYPYPIIAAPPPPPPPPPRPGVPPQRARANLGAYFSGDDYPAAALRNKEQGMSSFRLTIGVTGRVSNCMITGSSGSTALDAATCRILRSRARYTPARDVNGDAVEGIDRGRVRWELPDEPHDPSASTLAAEGQSAPTAPKPPLPPAARAAPRPPPK